MKNENSSIAAAPIIVKHPANARGLTEIDWLYSRHSFSFGEYYDPAHMGFSSLRVINDDIIQPGQGFGTHPHRNAEIFTYVIEGELEHRDSMGNGSIIKAGDLQYMSAGSGVRHSEFNPSKTSRVHLLQIWLLPNINGGEPRYAEKHLGSSAKPNALALLFSGQPRENAIAIRQDAEIFFGRIDAGNSLAVDIGSNRRAWLQLIEGELQLGAELIRPGDGVEISEVAELTLTAKKNAEFLFFNLP